jgi:hypothetical protein
VESLIELSGDARRRYLGLIDSLAEWLAPAGGGSAVTLRGAIEVTPDHWVAIGDDSGAVSVPLPKIPTAARRVGSYIATAKLRALGSRSIQEIETWDEADETTALGLIAKNLCARQAIRGLADDAQQLAGAILAVIQEPGLYEAVNASLAEALAWSFERDPVVGYAAPHPVIGGIPGLLGATGGADAGSESDPLAAAPSTGPAKMEPTPVKKGRAPAAKSARPGMRK